MPDYYGTGRQPKKKKSYVGLAVTLVVVLLAANAVPFLIPYLQQMQNAPERAMPADERKLTLRQEDAQQKQTAACGMLICELDDSQQRYWNLPGGVIVGQVDENGTASNAGILPGDVILRIGDAKPATAEDCRALLTSYKDGDAVQIELYRSGETLQIELTYRAEE